MMRMRTPQSLQESECDKPVVENIVRYPPLSEPEIGSGRGTPMVPGLVWLRMPLEGQLASINIWALEDGDGFTVVDTGIRSPDTLVAWRRAAEETFDNRTIHRVIATHMHPDHAGMAGWLCSHYGARLWMTRLEYLTLRMLASDHGNAPDDAVGFYRAAGMDEAWLDRYRLRFGDFARRLYPLPVQFRAMCEGDTIRVGCRDWRVVTGGGHSPEHASLWSPKDRILISGDQVLPTISSNVSLHPYEPGADPLNAWLAGLIRVRETVPDDVLVLPSHGRPFRGLHRRIDALIGAHEAGLARLFEMLATSRRAVDVFPALFRREIKDDFTRMLGVGEALAHLACLKARGLIQAKKDGDGVLWWMQL